VQNNHLVTSVLQEKQPDQFWELLYITSHLIMLTAELWVGAMAKRLSMFAATLTLLRAGIYGRGAYF
jgi:hypothetical protein